MHDGRVGTDGWAMDGWAIDGAVPLALLVGSGSASVPTAQSTERKTP